MTGDPGSAPAQRPRVRWQVRALALLVLALLVLAGFEVGLRIAWRRTWKATSQQSWHEFDPVLGWRHKRGARVHAEPTAESPDLARPFDVRLNGLGLREDRELVLPAPAGTRRVACLGDSYTFGWCVPAEATFARRLQARLGAPFEVWNWGVSGYGLDQSLLELERDVLPTRPDLVVFSVIDANFRRATTALGPGLVPKPRFFLDGNELVRPSEPVRELKPGDAFCKTDASGSYVLWSFQQAIDRARIGLAADKDAATEDWRLGSALIREAARCCREAHVPLLVALLPTVTHLDGEPLERLVPTLAGEGLAVANVCPAFRSAKRPDHPLFIPKDRHPDEEGHEVIAAELERAIRENGLLR